MELFEGLTESEIKYLQHLKKQGYFDGIDMYLDLDSSSDYRINKFVDNGYISLRDAGPHNGSRYVDITGKGIAALVDYSQKCKPNYRATVFRFLAWAIPCFAGVLGAIFAYLSLSAPQ